jgi:hypothetical protein
MKRYIFKVTLSGLGNTEADAWEDAVEQFSMGPGTPDDDPEIEFFDEEA